MHRLSISIRIGQEGSYEDGFKHRRQLNKKGFKIDRD
jgi:Ser-tRNA(Ala) deacylase AlaX